MTLLELAESIGMTQAVLTRSMNGRERFSVELLETVAQALDAAPEFFAEYRLLLVDEWLRQHPARSDELFAELSSEPALGEYHAWPLRPLPDPLDCSPRALIESLLEIVSAEGPVMGARVYELRLSGLGLDGDNGASGPAQPRDSAAASRAGLIIDENERGTRRKSTASCGCRASRASSPRVLGGRQLWQVPASRTRERDHRLRPTWKRGESVASRIQTAIMAKPMVSRAYRSRDAEHLNRCITRRLARRLTMMENSTRQPGGRSRSYRERRRRRPESGDRKRFPAKACEESRRTEAHSVILSVHLEAAEQLAGAFRDSVRAARAGWSFDDRDYLESGAFAHEVTERSVARRVWLCRNRTASIVSYPSLVRVLPNDAAIEIDRKRHRGIRPSVLVETLRAAQERPPRFRPEVFIEALARAYELVSASEGQGVAVRPSS